MYLSLRKTIFFFSFIWFSWLSAQDCAVIVSSSQNLDETVVCSDGSTGLNISVTASNAQDAQWEWFLYERADLFDNNNRQQPINGPSFDFTPLPTQTAPCDVCPSILGILVDACNSGGYGEGNNEFMVIASGSGFRGGNLQIDFGFEGNSEILENNDINIGANACSFRNSPEETLMNNLRTGAPNCTFEAAGPNTNIPANALVLVFASSNAQRPYDLSGLCPADGTPIYVLQNQCTRRPDDGAFSNGNDSTDPFTTGIYLNNCTGGCQAFFTYNRGEIGNLSNRSTFIYKETDGSTVILNEECSVPVSFELGQPENLYSANTDFELDCQTIDLLKTYPDQTAYLVGVFISNGNTCFPESGRTQPIRLTYSDQCGTPSLEDLPNTCPGQQLDLSRYISNPDNEPFSFSGAEVVGTIFTAPEITGTYFVSIEGNCEPFPIVVESGETVEIRDGSFCAQSPDIDLDDLIVSGSGTWQIIDENGVATVVNNDAIRSLSSGTYQLILVGCNQDTATVEILPVAVPRVSRSKICRQDTTFEFEDLLREEIAGEWLYEGNTIPVNVFLELEPGPYSLRFEPNSPCIEPLTISVRLIEDPEPPIQDTTICRDQSIELLALLSEPTIGSWEDITNPFFPIPINQSTLNLNQYATGTINVRFRPNASDITLCKDSYTAEINLVEGNDQFDTIQVCGESYTLPSGDVLTKDSTVVLTQDLGNCTIQENITYFFSPFDTTTAIDTFNTCENEIQLDNGIVLTRNNPSDTLIEIDSANCTIQESIFLALFSAGEISTLPADTICYGEFLTIGTQNFSYDMPPSDTVTISSETCDSRVITSEIVFLEPKPMDTVRLVLCEQDTFRFNDEAGNLLDVFTADMGTSQLQPYNNYTYADGCQGTVVLDLTFSNIIVQDTSITAPCDVQLLEFNGIAFSPEKRVHDFVLDSTGACLELLRVTVFFRNPNIVTIRDTVACGENEYRDPFASPFLVITKEMPDTIVYDYDMEGCITGGTNYIIEFPDIDTVAPSVSACPGEAVQIGNQTFSEADLPEYVLAGTNQFGCDSFVHTINYTFRTADTVRNTFIFCLDNIFEVETIDGLITLERSAFETFPTTRFFNKAGNSECQQVEAVTFIDNLPVDYRTQFDTCYFDSLIYKDVVFTPENNIQSVTFEQGTCSINTLVEINFGAPTEIFPLFLDTAACNADSYTFELAGQQITATPESASDTLQFSDGICLSELHPYSIHFPQHSDTTDIGSVQVCTNSPFELRDPRLDSTYIISNSGPFSITMKNIMGCDSVIIGNLQRSDNIFASLTGDNTICKGDSATISFQVAGIQELDLQLQVDNIPFATLNQVRNGDFIKVAPEETTIYQLRVINSGQLPCPPLSQGSVLEISVEELDYDIQSLDKTCREPGSVSIEADGNHRVEWEDGTVSFNRIFDESGTYNFTIEKNVCSREDSVIIGGDSATATIDLPSLQCDANSGNITINLSENRFGLQANLQNAMLDSNYNLSGPPYQLTAVPLGSYLLQITDSLGCSLYNDSVKIAAPLRVMLPPLADSSFVNPTRVIVDLNTETAPISWSPGSLVTCISNNCSRAELNVNSTTTFSYQVQDTAICSNGIQRVSYAIIENTFAYPNAIIADDGNGFTIHSTDREAIITSLQIFDRWGTIVFEQKDIPVNDKMLAWNGTFQNELLPSGVYIFKATLLKSNGDKTNLTDDILLVRK